MNFIPDFRMIFATKVGVPKDFPKHPNDISTLTVIYHEMFQLTHQEQW